MHTVYEAAGGEAAFRRLVALFYERVADDPVLRPLYPEQDLGPAQERLTLFLVQYWGGPATYTEKHGHPRLRMRHVPFAIGWTEREAWFRHMSAAVVEMRFEAEVTEALLEYFDAASRAMINRPANA